MGILAGLWLLGFAPDVAGALVHLLAVAVLVLALVGLVIRRRTV